MKAAECALEDMVPDLTPFIDGIIDLIILRLPEYTSQFRNKTEAQLNDTAHCTFKILKEYMIHK